MNQQQMDPALIAQIMGMEDPENDPEQMKLARQQKMIEQLRGQVNQQGGGRMVGDRYVAPNLGASLMNAGSMVAGGLAQRGIDDKMTAMGGQRANTRGAYFQQMLKAMRGSKGVPGGVPPMMGPQMPGPYEDE